MKDTPERREGEANQRLLDALKERRGDAPPLTLAELKRRRAAKEEGAGQNGH